MKRFAAIVAIAAGLTLSSPAAAKDGKTSWIQLPPVCHDTADALEERRKASVDACKTTDEGDKADAEAVRQCMEDSGWTSASKETVETYERFCGIVRRLSTPDDDPKVVVHVPNPVSK